MLNSYGFIESPTLFRLFKQDAFLRREHRPDCVIPGTKVSFVLELGPTGGPQAVDVMPPDAETV